MSRYSIQTVFVTFLIILIINQRGYAWFNPTHMSIAAIAYTELKNKSPKTLGQVITLLKKHPYYQSHWEPQINKLNLSKGEHDKYLFMLAARWPDDVKGGDLYHDHPTWHFINYPYVPQPDGIHVDTMQSSEETILTAYQKNHQLVNSREPDSVKAIALCWLLHLIGDVHMPLHTATLIDGQFPKGDKGGNIFKVKLDLSSPTISLHAFWDGILLDSDEYHLVDKLTLRLLHAFPRNKLPQLQDSNILSWSKKSFQLAKDNAYRSNTLKSGGADRVVLPVDYAATVKPIAERQAALAGYRVADELITNFAK